MGFIIVIWYKETPPKVMTLDCPLVVTFRQGSQAAPAGTPADGRRRIKCVIDGQQLGWGF